jgi:uncharacterized protein with von Willebrand factor type A (vWA) domain
MAERVRKDSPEVNVPEETKAASAAELLQRKDFATLTEEERAAVLRAMRDLRLVVARRRTRRRIAARSGEQIDLRRTLRAVSRYGVVLSPPRRARKYKERQLVVLADVSGSMELYARLLHQFFHGLTQTVARTETFAFGTRLTRITGDLRTRDVDVALDRAAETIVDFGGGTRIGESLSAFRRQHAGRVLRRGAVVVIVSDGCETGDPSLLAREMERLAARAHRVVWLNPLLRSQSYEVRVAGMARALAHVDDFLPIHDLCSLRQLATVLARVPARRGRKVGTFPVMMGRDPPHPQARPATRGAR